MERIPAVRRPSTPMQVQAFFAVFANVLQAHPCTWPWFSPQSLRSSPKALPCPRSFAFEIALNSHTPLFLRNPKSLSAPCLSPATLTQQEASSEILSSFSGAAANRATGVGAGIGPSLHLEVGQTHCPKVSQEWIRSRHCYIHLPSVKSTAQKGGLRPEAHSGKCWNQWVEPS